MALSAEIDCGQIVALALAESASLEVSAVSRSIAAADAGAVSQKSQIFFVDDFLITVERHFNKPLYTRPFHQAH